MWRWEQDEKMRGDETDPLPICFAMLCPCHFHT